MDKLIKFLKWVIAVFLLIAIAFLLIGDASDRYWFALFKENEYIFILLLLIVVRRLVVMLAKHSGDYRYTLKSWNILDYIDSAIAFISFYCVFHVAILSNPLRPYRDFTQNPAIIALFIWAFVVFITIKIFVNVRK